MRWAETNWPNRAEGVLGLLTHGLRPDWKQRRPGAGCGPRRQIGARQGVVNALGSADPIDAGARLETNRAAYRGSRARRRSAWRPWQQGNSGTARIGRGGGQKARGRRVQAARRQPGEIQGEAGVGGHGVFLYRESREGVEDA